MSFKLWLEAEVAEPQFVGFQGQGNPGERPMQVCYAMGDDHFMSCILRDLTLTDPVEVRDPRYDAYGPPRRKLLPLIQRAFDRDFGHEVREAVRVDDVLSILAGIFHGAIDTATARLRHHATPILADRIQDNGGEVVPGYLRDQSVPDQGVGPYGYYMASRGACTMAIFSSMLFSRLRAMSGPREDEGEPVQQRVNRQEVPVRFIGRHRDEKGVLWDVWEPDGNAMSAYVQLTHPTKRAQSRYDAGRGFRSQVRRDWIEAGRPSREAMEQNAPPKPTRRNKP